MMQQVFLYQVHDLNQFRLVLQTIWSLYGLKRYLAVSKVFAVVYNVHYIAVTLAGSMAALNKTSKDTDNNTNFTNPKKF